MRLPNRTEGRKPIGTGNVTSVEHGFAPMAAKPMLRNLLAMLLCVSMLLLAVVQAWGSPGRMVLVNGKLHRILRNAYSNNELRYARGHADGDWKFDSESITLPAFTTPWPSRTWIPKYGTNADAVETFAAEGLAVFDNKIFVAFTADADGSNHSAGMDAYVAAFDLTPTTDAPDGHWLLFPGGKGGGNTEVVQYNKVAIGSARVDTPAKGWGSGAAITVCDNQLYLFTNSGVYTSGDGTSWTYHAVPFTTNAQHEPLDAVTLNTPDGQRILVAYGYISGQHYYYDHLDAVDWNGKFGSESQSKIHNGSNDGGLYDPSGHWRGRVSLSVGTKAKGNAGDNEDLAAGALAPAVQLFGQSGEQFTSSNHNPARHAEYVYTSIDGGWGTWTWDSTRVKYFDHVNPSLMVYPWSEFKCNSSYPDRQAVRQYIALLGGYNWWITETPFAFGSDFLVPQHIDAVPACTFVDTDGKTKPTPPPAGIENVTESISKKYWTLVGVILGSPPFSRQGLPEGSNLIGELSGVDFNRSTTNTTETTTVMENTASVSVGRKITVGLLDMLHFSRSFDATYKHTWEKESGTKSSVTVAISDELGTGKQNYNVIGTRGWALFSAPHVYVQNSTLYAYDYRTDASIGGTALIDQGTGYQMDLQTISTKGRPDYVLEDFDLRDPVSKTAEYPEGTKPWFKGMGSFNYGDVYDNAANLDYWMAPKNLANGEILNWQNDARWETRAGDGGTTWYPCKSTTSTCTTDVLATSSSKRTIGYTLATESMTGSGHTNEIQVNAGMSMGGQVGLKGFSIGAENNISVGYDGRFSWNTKTTTGIGTTLAAYATTPACSDRKCFDRMRIRTYWLHPVASAAAEGKVPWVPTAYSSQLPWCLTWRISMACRVGEYCDDDAISMALSAPNSFGGGISGTALPPARAFGRIVNGTGGSDGGAPYSHYVVQAGRLAWTDEDGRERRIPMTAELFDPAKGVTIEVASGSWSSSGNGSWHRSGKVWKFQSNPGAKPSVSLSLDFGSATYDLAIDKADFNGRLLAGVTQARLVLGVNQLYTFYTVLNHDINLSWRWNKPAPDDLRAHVTSFEGRYDSTNQSGKMSLAGTLPAVLPDFGDVEINVNDHPLVVRLITMDGFQEAFETGGGFKYAKEGVILEIDFGKRTWSATFNEKGFHNLLAPRWGTVRARFVVGGVPWLTEDGAVVDYSALLELRH
ncbi:hypothetical protein [Geomonas ferrireducens]|uniref:hypothetical protein n=1 Tax=Geomonas ferrireducens TaxID=2570227 RepID=UPI0010A85ED2|nr:hypothetical protein [Geomonas ferrireducens]